MSWTREDQNRAWRSWYRRNRAKKISWQNRRRQEIRDWVAAQKARGCARCGEMDTACLDFHHRDRDDKTIEIATKRTEASKWVATQAYDDTMPIFSLDGRFRLDLPISALTSSSQSGWAQRAPRYTA